MVNNYGIAILPILAASFLLITLSGCSSIISKPSVQPINIPTEKFQCEEPLPRPTGDVIMESQVAKYINSLEYTTKDCKTRLKELQVIVKCYNDPKCDVKTLINYIGLADDPKAR
jgi:hypothetical protein